jgi:hypothetical protein
LHVNFIASFENNEQSERCKKNETDGYFPHGIVLEFNNEFYFDIDLQAAKKDLAWLCKIDPEAYSLLAAGLGMIKSVVSSKIISSHEQNVI